MRERMLAATQDAVARLPLEEALSRKPVVVSVMAAVAGVMVLAATLTTSFSWTVTGIRRYASPWGSTEWPRAVSLRALTADQTVAVGESALVRLAVDRGLHATLRPVVHVRPGGRGEESL